MTWETKQRLCIEAVDMQRRALHLSRWAYLNERGAFELADAAALLRESARRLEMVSEAVLLESRRYDARAFRRSCEAA